MVSHLITKLLDGYQPNREPSLDWLPVYTPRRSGKRVKRFHILISPSREMVVSLRRFATRPETRSKRVRQLVLRVHFLGFREAAIAVERRNKSKKPSVSSPLRVLLLQSSKRLVPALFLVLIGATGGVYFGSHLSGPAQLYLPKGSVSNGAGQRFQPHIASPATLKLNPKTTEKLSLADANLANVTASKPTASTGQAKEVAAPPPKTMPRSQPIRLRIPKIAIDTSVVPIGLRPAGAIALPDSFEEVGWYSEGPTPGELGPAVIVGHVDSTQGIAIFWNLRELLPGDTFQIDRADGTTATFKVLEVEQFSQEAFPTENVYGNIRYAGVRLITCGGTFSTVTHHYDQNTVVYGALQ